MTDNIKPEHYRTGEIDLYEAWYRTYPFEQYRAIMQAVAERYMRRDKSDRVEDLDKAIYTLERLREKEIEHDDSYEEISTKDGTVLVKSDDNIKFQKKIDILNFFLELGFKYLARDRDDCIWMYGIAPKKGADVWATCYEDKTEEINKYSFPEVKWTDDDPTKIADLLASYENGGENGK